MNVTDGRGRAASAPGLAAWLRRVAPPRAVPEITIALVSDARIRALNRQFRRKDAVTDVLSFEPADIAIGVGVARRQARESGHSYAVELKILALHGLLHLMGYDHHDPVDRGRMVRLERRLRAKGGLNEGLIERVERASVVSQRPERRSERAKRRDPRRRNGYADVRSERAKRSAPGKGKQYADVRSERAKRRAPRRRKGYADVRSERAKRRAPGKRKQYADVRSERAKRSEPRDRSEPAKRRARARVGESEGRSPSGKK